MVGRGKSKDLQRLSLPMLGLTVFPMAAEWILLVAGTRLHEMVVGAVSLTAAGAFLYFVHSNGTLHLELRAADVLAGWRIPWYLVSGTYEITVVLLKDLVSIERAGSFFRVSGFRTSYRDPRLVARRVLAIAYTTVAPNFIILGIDYQQSRMLFHQIKRSSVPKMTKDLGAQS